MLHRVLRDGGALPLRRAAAAVVLLAGCASEPSPPAPASASASAAPRAPRSRALADVGCGRAPKAGLCAALAAELDARALEAAAYSLRPHGAHWEHVCELAGGAAASAIEAALTRSRGPGADGGPAWDVSSEVGCAGARLFMGAPPGRPAAVRVAVPDPPGSYCGTSKPRLALCGTWGDAGELRVFADGPSGRFELSRAEGALTGEAEIDDAGTLRLRVDASRALCGRLDAGRLALDATPGDPARCATPCASCPRLARR